VQDDRILSMKIKFNQITWYSRLFTILFVLGIFPVLVFYIAEQYSKTVTVLNYADASAYQLHNSGAYLDQAYTGAGASETEAKLAGVWESLDDSKYTVHFKSTNTFYEYYEHKIVASGSWLLRDKRALQNQNLEDVSSGIYLQKNSIDRDEKEEIFYYKINAVSRNELVLTYIDHGNILRFKKIKD